MEGERVWMGRERRERGELSGLVLQGHESYWVRALPFRPHLTLVMSIKAPSPNIAKLEIRAST